MIEKQETDWADEKINNSRAFGGVSNVDIVGFLRAGESGQRKSVRLSAGLYLLQRPCQSSIMSSRGETTLHRRVLFQK